MDKYEYKLKLEQMRNLVEAKDYKTAAQIAESINWKKVKSVSTLCMVGEIFEKTKQLEESREILLMAYDRSPVGRNIIYRLTHVAVKMGSIEEAQEYYEEFIELAPHDNMKYVLKYEIAKAKGESLEELISILEEFKDREYTEEWAFELAYLYHKGGKTEKCVEICDELILWFGEGKYVEKALELKMLYQPLNKLQEDKYRRFKQKQEGVVEVSPREELASGEILSDTVKIPRIHSDTGRFNTINLQAELAKSMQQILDATEQGTVSDTMNSIKKMVQEMPRYYRPEPEEPEEEKPEPESLRKEEPRVQPEPEEPEEEKPEPESLWKEEPKAQPEPESVQQPEPVEQSEPELEPEPALHIDFKGILAEEYDGQISLRVPDAPKQDLQITGQMSIEDILAEWERTKEAARAAMEEAQQRKLEEAKARALQEAESLIESLAELQETDQAKEIPKQQEAEQPAQVQSQQEAEPAEEERRQEAVSVPPAESSITEQIVKRQEKEQLALERQVREEHMLTKEITLEEDLEADKPLTKLNDEQKEIFTYFTLIGGMERQLCQALEGVKDRKKNNQTSMAGNLIISGGKGSGKTVLATDFIKAYQRMTGRMGGKVGKISASVLNQKDIEKLFQAVEGGYLIIEKAGSLSRESVEKLSRLMEGTTKGLLVVLEDDKTGIAKAVGRSPEFARKFTEKINIPIFTNDELVVFARAYAKEQNCEIEDMGVLALYNSISNIQKLDEATTLTEVKEIMDEAIHKANKGGWKKLFGGKRSTENGRTLIKEKDFEE